MKYLGDARKREKMMEYVCSIAGNLIYSAGFNLLIVPMGLYSGGFMGISQLTKLLLTRGLHLPIPPQLNLTGILYFVLIFHFFT